MIIGLMSSSNPQEAGWGPDDIDCCLFDYRYYTEILIVFFLFFFVYDVQYVWVNDGWRMKKSWKQRLFEKCGDGGGDWRWCWYCLASIVWYVNVRTTNNRAWPLRLFVTLLKKTSVRKAPRRKVVVVAVVVVVDKIAGYAHYKYCKILKLYVVVVQSNNDQTRSMYKYPKNIRRTGRDRWMDIPSPPTPKSFHIFPVNTTTPSRRTTSLYLQFYRQPLCCCSCGTNNIIHSIKAEPSPVRSPSSYLCEQHIVIISSMPFLCVSYQSSKSKGGISLAKYW